MAPRTTGPGRRKTVNNEAVFSLGVQGRKTGVFLPDDGVRDEHGIQPLDGIFDSSPAKGSPGEVEEISEVDMSMDIENTPGPDPRSLLRRAMPRAMSPAKGSLRSPPRRTGPSSPLQPSTIAPNGSAVAKSTARKLDFNSLTHTLPRPSSSHATKVLNGHSGSAEDEDEDDADSTAEAQLEDTTGGGADDSMQMLDIGGDDEPEENEDEDEGSTESNARQAAAAAAAAASRKKAAAKSAGPQKRGRKRRSNGPDTTTEDHVQDVEKAHPAHEDDEGEEESVQTVRRRGHPAKAKANDAAKAPAPKVSKRQRDALSSPVDITAEEPEPEPAAKRARVAAKTGASRKPVASAPRADSSPPEPPTEEEAEPVDAKNKGRRGRPVGGAKRSADPDTSVVVPSRPPLPKRSGLVINQKPKPGDSSDMFQTRSGRSSYKPLAFWRGERPVFDPESGNVPNALARGKKWATSLRLPSIKEIYRVEEAAPPERKNYPRRPGGARKRRHDDDDDGVDDEADAWELESGELVGPVAVWEARHEIDPPGVDDDVQIKDDRLAVAGSAIVTHDVLSGNFRLNKLLTLPFFSMGVIDIPAGGVKKAKNSRRMHMTFIVHTGRVEVVINETTFSIGRGSVFIVPRGNYYSIANEGRRNSRIFYHQGNEVLVTPEEGEEEEEEVGTKSE